MSTNDNPARRFCGEIQYEIPEGYSIHSDICWGHDPREEAPVSDEHRAFLHACLDEWLNKSGGTGGFWLGDKSYFVGWGG